MNPSTDELLEELRPYATIIFGQYRDETWSATAKLRIRAEGAKFEIDSGFKNESANAALMVLRNRVMDVVSQASDLKRLGECRD